MQDQKLVFITGLHRSGTSLLFRILRDHPDISGFRDTGAHEDEGQHLQSVYLPAGRYGGAGRFGFNDSAYLDETSSLVSESNSKKIFLEWAKHWDIGRPLLIEKSPPNLIRTRFLQALFPNSIFIILLRHPIPTCLATQRWSKTTLFSLIEHWLICYERFEIDKEYIQDFIVMKYEDIVVEPEKQLAKVYDFLNIKNVSVNQEINSNVNTKYLLKWKKIKNNIITRYFANRIINKFEKRVNNFGYSLTDINMSEKY
ncbi:MAG: sulfotransferase family protein [Candidatus Anammoxibacter sp.]